MTGARDTLSHIDWPGVGRATTRGALVTIAVLAATLVGVARGLYWLGTRPVPEELAGLVRFLSVVVAILIWWAILWSAGELIGFVS